LKEILNFLKVFYKENKNKKVKILGNMGFGLAVYVLRGCLPN
jgi:hypothetical protein